MFKGLLFILVLGLIVVFVIIAIIASFVYRMVHRVKKVLNGENPNDDYNPEIGKKHQHYTHKQYGRSTRQSTSSNNQQSTDNDHIHKTGTGEILFETRNPDQVNRQIFSADEGEYVEFSEEH